MNLVRMNLYRFFREKSLYVLLLITGFMIALAVLGESSTSSEEYKQLQMVEEEKKDEISVGFTLGMIKIDNMNDLQEAYIGAGIMLVLVGLFIVIYTYNERNSGYLKNLSSIPQSKIQMILARFVCVVLFVILEFAVMILLGFAFGLTIADVGDFVSYLLLQLLLHMSFGALCMFAMEVFRNLTAGIMVSIVVPMGLIGMLISYIDKGIHHIIGNVDFYISEHLLSFFVRALNTELMPTYATTAFISGIVGLVMYIGLTIWTARKRDMY